MDHSKRHSRFNFFTRCICSVLILSFSSTSILPPGYAQTIGLQLPIPGTMVSQSPAFVPVLLKGMTVYPDDPLQFEFIIDSGNDHLSQKSLKKETDRLVKYFFASMTVPQNDLWVNLSPHEKNRIIPDELSKTELGRDLLAQDYILKQLTATMMYPEEELGKKFWDRVYKKIKDKYGDIEILPTSPESGLRPSANGSGSVGAMNTFNKVWILPERAQVYEYENTVYITDSHLKVMLDSDYLAAQENQSSPGHQVTRSPEIDNGEQKTESGKNPSSVIHHPLSKNSSDLGDEGTRELVKKVIKDVILPEIEKEVNTGKNFATIRQIYHSLILAKWYKQTVKDSIMSQVYIDKNKTAGIETGDVQMKEKIYGRYMEAYKKGVFNYIKEDYDELSNTVIPRQYFSGGFVDELEKVEPSDNALLAMRAEVGDEHRVIVKAKPQTSALEPKNTSALETSSALGNQAASALDSDQAMIGIDRATASLIKRRIRHLTDDFRAGVKIKAGEELSPAGEYERELIELLDHETVEVFAKAIVEEEESLKEYVPREILSRKVFRFLQRIDQPWTKSAWLALLKMQSYQEKVSIAAIEDALKKVGASNQELAEGYLWLYEHGDYFFDKGERYERARKLGEIYPKLRRGKIKQRIAERLREIVKEDDEIQEYWRRAHAPNVHHITLVKTQVDPSNEKYNEEYDGLNEVDREVLAVSTASKFNTSRILKKLGVPFTIYRSTLDIADSTRHGPIYDIDIWLDVSGYTAEELMALLAEKGEEAKLFPEAYIVERDRYVSEEVRKELFPEENGVDFQSDVPVKNEQALPEKALKDEIFAAIVNAVKELELPADLVELYEIYQSSIVQEHIDEFRLDADKVVVRDIEHNQNHRYEGDEFHKVITEGYFLNFLKNELEVPDVELHQTAHWSHWPDPGTQYYDTPYANHYFSQYYYDYYQAPSQFAPLIQLVVLAKGLPIRGVLLDEEDEYKEMVDAGIRQLGKEGSIGLIGKKEEGFHLFNRLGLPYPPGIVLSKEFVEQLSHMSSEDIEYKIAPYLIKALDTIGVKISANKDKYVMVRSAPEQSMPGKLRTKAHTGSAEMLASNIGQVIQSWFSEKAIQYRKLFGIPETFGLSIIIQEQKKAQTSSRDKEESMGYDPEVPLYGSGAFSTRNPDTNEDVIYGSFISNLSGDTLMTGGYAGEEANTLAQRAPGIYQQLWDAKAKLEEASGPQEVEFVVSNGVLYFTQTRPIHFSPQAESAYVTELLEKGKITEARALAWRERIQKKVKQRTVYKLKKNANMTEVARSSAATSGVIQGYLAFNVEQAERLIDEGKPVIVVMKEKEKYRDRRDLLPLVFKHPNTGVITDYGSGSSHEAVLTRLMGIPSLINLERELISEPGDGYEPRWDKRLPNGRNYLGKEYLGDEARDNGVILLNDGRKLYGGDRVVIDGNNKILGLADDDVTEEDGFAFDASYGIDIEETRKEFSKPYLNPDGNIREEFAVARLEELNRELDKQYMDLDQSGDKKEAFLANIKKHAVHDLLKLKQDQGLRRAGSYDDSDQAMVSSVKYIVAVGALAGTFGVMLKSAPQGIEAAISVGMFVYYLVRDNKDSRDPASMKIDLMSSILRAALERPKAFPFARVAASFVWEDGSRFDIGSNSSGAGEHAEINLILDILRKHAADVDPEYQERYTSLLDQMEKKIKEGKLGTDENLLLLREAVNLVPKLPFKNSTLFINLMPCPNCQAVLKELAVTNIVYNENHPDKTIAKKWQKDLQEFVNKSGITVEFFPVPKGSSQPNKIFDEIVSRPQGQEGHSRFQKRYQNTLKKEGKAFESRVEKVLVQNEHHIVDIITLLGKVSADDADDFFDILFNGNIEEKKFHMLQRLQSTEGWFQYLTVLQDTLRKRDDIDKEIKGDRLQYVEKLMDDYRRQEQAGSAMGNHSFLEPMSPGVLATGDQAMVTEYTDKEKEEIQQLVADLNLFPSPEDEEDFEEWEPPTSSALPNQDKQVERSSEKDDDFWNDPVHQTMLYLLYKASGGQPIQIDGKDKDNQTGHSDQAMVTEDSNSTEITTQEFLNIAASTRVLLEARERKLQINDIVVLGNDVLETFRHALRLLQSGIGERIVISGGEGRLTLPLIRNAVDAGYHIRLSSDIVITADNFQDKSPEDWLALARNNHASESSMISQIMRQMINEKKGEFQELKEKLKKKPLFKNSIISLEQFSTNTLENLEYYKRELINEDRLSSNKKYRILIIQAPHQQLRAKGNYVKVFEQEIKSGQIDAASFSSEYDPLNKSQQKFAQEVVGEAWRIVVYALKGDIKFLEDEYTNGLLSVDEALWNNALRLLLLIPENELEIFANGLLTLWDKDPITLEEQIEQLGPQTAVYKFSKSILDLGIDHDAVEQKFEADLKKGAMHHGIDINEQTRIALFIGGPQVFDKYYYRMFEDVMRNQLKQDLVYLPFPVQGNDKARIEFIKSQLEQNERFIGAVVTRPFKQTFYKKGDNQLGAINYIVRDQGGEIKRSAVDGLAWIDGLNRDLGREYDFNGKTVVVIGSGGAASEITEAISNKGTHKIIFTDVDQSRLDDMRETIEKLGLKDKADFINTKGKANEGRLKEIFQDADVIINATGIGRDDSLGQSPVPANLWESVDKDAVVSDLISNVDTQFLQDARNVGGIENAFYGRSMFIYGMVIFMQGWIKVFNPQLNVTDGELYEKIDQWLKEDQADQAMLTSALEPKSPSALGNQGSSDLEKGGIDMNDISVDRQAGTEAGKETHTIQFELDGMEPLLNMDIQGFSPIIIEMIPINSVLPLLGLRPMDKGIKYGKEEAEAELIGT